MNTPKNRTPRAASGAKGTPAIKASLHPANPHLAGYDMTALARTYPALTRLLIRTPRGEQSVDFADPVAVKTLNQALLAHHYQLPHWDLPEGYLCPPVPGRLECPNGPYCRTAWPGVGLLTRKQAQVVGAGNNLSIHWRSPFAALRIRSP